MRWPYSKNSSFLPLLILIALRFSSPAFRSHLEDYSAPVAMAGRRHSQQTRTHPHDSRTTESGVCCEVCQKTKIVGEQSARQCSICKKRLCVRCGVRLKGHPYNKVNGPARPLVSLRSFVVQIYWICNICRQKQERYFSSRKMIPTTSSVSQLTSKSNNASSLDDDAMTKNISKQYVSDYILSQPFDDDNNDDGMPMNQNGANKKKVIPPSIQQRKRMLPTAHIRRQQQQPQKQLSSDHDDDAASTPDSASAMDETESVPRGTQPSPLSLHVPAARRRQRAPRHLF